MVAETKPGADVGTGPCACPVCALWAAYKDSEAAKHVRGIQREALLLVRNLLDACICKAEKHPAETPPKP